MKNNCTYVYLKEETLFDVNFFNVVYVDTRLFSCIAIPLKILFLVVRIHSPPHIFLMALKFLTSNLLFEAATQFNVGITNDAENEDFDKTLKYTMFTLWW